MCGIQHSTNFWTQFPVAPESFFLSTQNLSRDYNFASISKSTQTLVTTTNFFFFCVRPVRASLPTPLAVCRDEGALRCRHCFAGPVAGPICLLFPFFIPVLFNFPARRDNSSSGSESSEPKRILLKSGNCISGTRVGIPNQFFPSAPFCRPLIFHFYVCLEINDKTSWCAPGRGSKERDSCFA